MTERSPKAGMSLHTPATLQRRGFDRAITVVQQHLPAVAPVLNNTIQLLMQDALSCADQQAAWTSSLLTSTGAPLEFSFSTLSEEIRYTVEVGGPTLAPGARLDRIEEASDLLGFGRQCREVTAQLRNLQCGSELRWGAWLGVRHRLDGSNSGYKIYAEVPSHNDMATRMINEYLISAPVLSGEMIPLVMVGKSLGSQRCEFYFEIPWRGLSAYYLAQLLALVGLEDRYDQLLELLRGGEVFPDSQNPSDIPEAQYGISYSVLPGRSEPLVSIIVFASDLIGGDGLVRYQMLIAARNSGSMLKTYLLLTEPFAASFFSSIYHSMISYTVGPSPVAGVQVCVSPPPEKAGT
jgi:hypothetical protein